ncbi:purine-nucleoside phosphorylase [Derxia lacustris]|uniref:purine-nucleoside phosphorylase n=1 Tax=Derxia lacustris TaxID=764842 RepID=UPI000A177307|nr:purine nucleoside permease [Derxia lacustris]
MPNPPFRPALVLALLTGVALLIAACSRPASPPAETAPRPVKLLIVNMFAPEAQPFIDGLKLDQSIAVPGLPPESPAVRCNADDVCQVTTGMGHANAAATLTALLFSRQFGFSRSYFLIAGIAGIDPARGTLGSAAWASWLIDTGLAWEIDARELPAGWRSGLFGINTKGPGEKPPLDYKTEAFRLDEALVARAYALSRAAPLEDSPEAVFYRAHWTSAPANQPPAVLRCDTASGDTWWHGELLGNHVREWSKLLSDGAADYCTTQQEDNASYEALKRGASAGLLDLKRVAVLRSGSNFDRPYPGQTAYDSLAQSVSGGFVPATRNLLNAGRPFIDDVVARWDKWKDGVPAN